MPAARIATPQDAEAAVRVLRRSITELCVPDHRNDPATIQQWLENKTVENFRAWLASKNNFCVVTELDGHVNGVGMINRSGEIQLCYLAPESQGRGVGSAILAALENEARAWGLKKLRLESTVSARAFYERRGYIPGGKTTGGFGLSSCYPYEKDLPVAAPFDAAERISREAMNDLPIRRYEGAVHLVEAAEDLQRAMQDIRRAVVVGFDTETRPAFRPGESYLPSLVQFATAQAVYLFQVQQHDYAAAMREIFESASIVKVGVSVADDLRNLKKSFGFEEQAMVDLGKVAKSHGLKQSGVRNLAGIFLGVRIPKGAKTTNWATRRLTPQQITYAATDAWACRELYLKFKALNLV